MHNANFPSYNNHITFESLFPLIVKRTPYFKAHHREALKKKDLINTNVSMFTNWLSTFNSIAIGGSIVKQINTCFAHVFYVKKPLSFIPVDIMS